MSRERPEPFRGALTGQSGELSSSSPWNFSIGRYGRESSSGRGQLVYPQDVNGGGPTPPGRHTAAAKVHPPSKWAGSLSHQSARLAQLERRDLVDVVQKLVTRPVDQPGVDDRCQGLSPCAAATRSSWRSWSRSSRASEV